MERTLEDPDYAAALAAVVQAHSPADTREICNAVREFVLNQHDHAPSGEDSTMTFVYPTGLDK